MDILAQQSLEDSCAFVCTGLYDPFKRIKPLCQLSLEVHVVHFITPWKGEFIILFTNIKTRLADN